MAGTVQTVLGSVDPGSLGRVLMHEHILIDAKPLGVPAPAHAPKDLPQLPFTLPALGHIRQFPYSHPCNLELYSDDDALKELQYFKESGGTTIVEVTTRGIGIEQGRRAAQRLAALSRLSGVQVVCGAGFYVGSTHPAELESASVEAVAAAIEREVTEGVDGSGVRAGIIGELGCSHPLKATEIKVLQAAALAQRRTGAAVMVHPGRNEHAPAEIVAVLRAAGADLSRVIIAHIDRTLYTLEAVDALVATGVVLELDLFGCETSYYQLNEASWMRSDEQRIDLVRHVLGCGGRVLLSHDIHTKHRTRTYGGHGYGYIFESIVPRLRMRGVSDADIAAMLEELPRELLTLRSPDA